MKRRCGYRLIGTIVLLSLCLAGPVESQVPEEIALTGRVLDPAGAPVSCCDLEIEVDFLDPWGPYFYYTTTDTEGDYSIVIACSPGANECNVVVRALCCDSEVQDIFPGCPESHEMPDLICVQEAETGYTILRGRVECRGPLGLPEGAEDCAVLVSTYCPGAPMEEVVAFTDSLGNYEVCLHCPVDCFIDEWVITVTSQCCNASDETVVFDMCPEEVTAPTLVCPQLCPDPPCDAAETLLRGHVKCDDPTQGEIGVPGCMVGLFVYGLGQGCENYSEVYYVETEADGTYEICVDCPPGCVDWGVEVIAHCCSAATLEEIHGCPSVVELDDMVCTTCPPPPPPCEQDETQLRGYVLCPDGTPVVDCTVTITATPCWPPSGYTVQTDENGYYEICVPCAMCPTNFAAIVVAECCGATTWMRVDCGDPINEVPTLVCDPCPPLRPCDEGYVEVTGRLLCLHDPLQPVEPIAGCPVLLEGVGCASPPVTVQTDGEGYYRACFFCDNCPQFEIASTALCCGATGMATVVDCPERVVVQEMFCPECDPCPADFTRYQGKVLCKDAGYHGPVADCPVEIEDESCDTPFKMTALTDELGRYHVCAPCPCENKKGVITAEALCCDGKKKKKKSPKECKPTTPMPTIKCKDCP